MTEEVDLELEELDEEEPTEPVSTRERLIMVACGFGVLIQSVRYYATLPLIGYLLTRPLRYEVIRPSEIAIVIGGAYSRVGKDPVWAVILLGLVGLSYVDPLRWLAGHRYGDKVALLLLGNQEKLVRRVERFTDRWGTWALAFGWFTPIPMFLIQLASGTSGMSFKRFILADLGGTLLYVLALFTLGYSIGQPAVNTIKHIGHYATYVTIAAIVLGVGYAMVKTYRNPPPPRKG